MLLWCTVGRCMYVPAACWRHTVGESCLVLCNYVLWLVSTVDWSCLVLYNTIKIM